MNSQKNLLNNDDKFIFKKINKFKKRRKLNKLFNNLKFCLPNEISFKFFKFYLIKNSNNANFAWKVYILLTTSILSNKISKNEGNFRTILDSIYNVFKKIQKYSLEYEGSKITTELSLYLLNKEIRPFLTKWHSKKINENIDILTDEFRNDLVKLQEKINDNYLEIYSDLARLYHKKERINTYISN